MSKTNFPVSRILGIVLAAGICLAAGQAQVQPYPEHEFVGNLYAHEWKAGAFVGSAYEIAFLSNDMLRWTATAGQAKGQSATENYFHVQLSPALHQFSWKEASTGYFVVLTYDLENKVVHGLVNHGDQIYYLKGPFTKKGIAK